MCGRLVPLPVVLATTILACGGSTEPSPSVAVRITDRPFADAMAVLVTFDEVSAHRAGEGGFTAIPFSPPSESRTCDLKKLVGAQDVLGTGSLAEGHYTQIRLTVSAASLYFESSSAGPACAATIAAPGGRSASLEIPSGEVKLNREFDVPSSGATTIILDFDGDASIHETGGGRFIMTPVVSVSSVQ